MEIAEEYLEEASIILKERELSGYKTNNLLGRPLEFEQSEAHNAKLHFGRLRSGLGGEIFGWWVEYFHVPDIHWRTDFHEEDAEHAVAEYLAKKDRVEDPKTPDRWR